MLSHFTLTSASSRSGCWLQMFMSRSLQQAEVLIRSSFNPSLKWLFRGHGQDQEEKNFVVAHNLVSRSSERLLRLQQALLSVAPQWQLVGSARLSQVNLYSLQRNWIVMGVRRRTRVNESSRSLISSKITSSTFWLFNCHFWEEAIILSIGTNIDLVITEFIISSPLSHLLPRLIRSVLKECQMKLGFFSCPPHPPCRVNTELSGDSWSSDPCWFLYTSTRGGPG